MRRREKAREEEEEEEKVSSTSFLRFNSSSLWSTLDEKRELTSVNGRVKSLNSTSEHLRSLGDGGDVPSSERKRPRSKSPSALRLLPSLFYPLTHSISIPASLIILAVPPDPRSLNPSSERDLAKGRRPVLS